MRTRRADRPHEDVATSTSDRAVPRRPVRAVRHVDGLEHAVSAQGEADDRMFLEGHVSP